MSKPVTFLDLEKMLDLLGKVWSINMIQTLSGEFWIKITSMGEEVGDFRHASRETAFINASQHLCVLLMRHCSTVRTKLERVDEIEKYLGEIART